MNQKKFLKPVIIVVAVVVIGALSMLVNALNQDKPPKLSLNGTELDLASLKLKDLNAAGFNMKNNHNKLEGETFYEMRAYYWGENFDISMGGISLLNRRSSSVEYADCEIFEISAKSRDNDGNLTGLQVTYNGEEVFGKTKAELTALFGEPSKELTSDKIVYYTKRNQYSTYFYFDSKTEECYLVEIHRREKGLVR
jgi:hypothetical protein